jgi:hypothetical protein
VLNDLLMKLLPRSRAFKAEKVNLTERKPVVGLRLKLTFSKSSLIPSKNSMEGMVFGIFDTPDFDRFASESC